VLTLILSSRGLEVQPPTRLEAAMVASCVPLPRCWRDYLLAVLESYRSQHCFRLRTRRLDVMSINVERGELWLEAGEGWRAAQLERGG
jgi:hypothetical protein